MAASVPVAADPVTCADGSTSKAGREACSQQGGVAKRRDMPRAERRRAPKRSQARATSTRTRTTPNAYDRATSQRKTGFEIGDGVFCADGSRTTATGKKACVHHGGVIGATAATPEPRIERDPAARTETATRETVTRRGVGSTLCNDGTMSTFVGHGACTGHGGVSDGATEFERHDGPIRARTPETQLCTDGTSAPAGAGEDACTDHGGVAAPPSADRGVRPEAPTPVGLCKNGEVAYSDDTGGVCAYHGGLSSWL
jgi:hypothetical protein